MTMGWKSTTVGLLSAVALIGGLSTPATAAPRAAAALATRDFDGAALGRTEQAAIVAARADARRQALAAGYTVSQCVTLFENADEITLDTEHTGRWVGESYWRCTN